MSTKPSLISRLTLQNFIISFVVMVMIGTLWIFGQYQLLEREAAITRERYVDDQRNSLKDVVHDAVFVVEYMRHQRKVRVDRLLRGRVLEAHSVASHLYSELLSKGALEGAEELIREALRPVRFNNSRGYFFAFDLNGVEKLFADRPELEGVNMLEIQGGEGEFVVRDMLNLVGDKGEGFYEYSWSKPGREGMGHRKLAYVKLFEPLGWVIGTGEYLEDIENDLKQEVLDYLGGVRYGNDEYIFVGDWKGVSLAGPEKGKNMFDVTDANGVEIVQELIRKAKEGGGFVEYVIPEFVNRESFRKLSYVEGIDEWQWYVGTGTAIDEIDAFLAQRRAEVENTIYRNILVSMLVFMILICLAYALTRRLGNRAEGSYQSFLHFFNSASQGDADIEPDKMAFSEFRDIATAAHHMIEQRQNMECALRESEHRFHSLLKQLPRIAVQGYDRNRKVIFWNKANEKINGYTESEAFGRRLEDLIIPQSMMPEVVASHKECMATGIPIPSREWNLKHKDGSLVTVHSSYVMQKNNQGESEMFCIHTDLTGIKKAERELKLAAIAMESHEAIMITDSEMQIQRVNTACHIMLGYSHDEIIGRKPGQFAVANKGNWHEQTIQLELDLNHRWRGEIWFSTHTGQEIPCWVAITTVQVLGNESNYVIHALDITDRKESEEEIRRLAYYDQLSGLPNRLLGVEHLTRSIVAARRHKHSVAVFFVDLDHFKVINDTLGHFAGDQLIQQVAQRISHCVREEDSVARLGGDEFMVIVNSVSKPSDAEAVAFKILDRLSSSFRVENNEHFISASIGITLTPQDGIHADELMKNADAAMYRAKAAGRNQLSFFTPDLDKEATERAHIDRYMRKALAAGDFKLHFQPIVEMATGRLAAAEALIRWQDDDLGMVSPDRFIPIAEETGVIIAIGDWVVREACRQLATWRDSGLALDTITVNVSSRQFRDRGFVDRVLQILDEFNLSPESLDLEITESVLMEELDSTESALHRLGSAGISLTIDDFGTGYSSLGYLHRLPVDKLKIDKSFIRASVETSEASKLIEAIIRMAQALGLDVVAEGVENTQQRDILIAMNCRYCQGYLFDRPLPPKDFLDSYSL